MKLHILSFNTLLLNKILFQKINFDFLKFFCGRHELLLNNLKSRWYLKYITNFIDFFQEPWTELLMHEEFESLRLVNKSLIKDTAKDILKKVFITLIQLKALQISNKNSYPRI